jgi:hypothetical protein
MSQSLICTPPFEILRILNPTVGIVSSSVLPDVNVFTNVVFPALCKPLFFY